MLPTPTVRWLALWTFVTGLVCSVGGGAGLLVAPLFMALGMAGDRVVATAASIAVSMHVGRALGYSISGGMASAVMLTVLPIAIALVAGNAAALPLRRRLPAARLGQLEVGALATVAACAIGRVFA